MLKTIVTVGLVLALVGCGSSGATADGGGGGHPGETATGGQGGAGGAGGATTCAPLGGLAQTSTGTMSWDQNGVLQCASLVETTRLTATAADTIEINAASSTSTAVDLALSTYSGLLGGTYTCQTSISGAPNVMLEISAPKAGGFAAMSDCTITISFMQDSSGIEHAQGTFSGSVTGDGGTEDVTNGMFDVTVTVQGG